MGKNTKEQGFTLIELLVVLAIIAIIAASLITSISSAKRRALDAATQSYLRNLAGHYVAYNTGHPTEDLSDMTTCIDTRLVSEGAPDVLPDNIVSACDVTVTSTAVTFTATSLSGKSFSYSW